MYIRLILKLNYVYLSIPGNYILNYARYRIGLSKIKQPNDYLRNKSLKKKDVINITRV